MNLDENFKLKFMSFVNCFKFMYPLCTASVLGINTQSVISMLVAIKHNQSINQSLRHQFYESTLITVLPVTLTNYF